jgi:Phosphoesterase family
MQTGSRHRQRNLRHPGLKERLCGVATARKLLLIGALHIALSGCGTILTKTPPPDGTPTAAERPSPAKVVLVILENEHAEVAHQPNFKFLWRLAGEGAYLSNYYAVAHPSQPNYIALVSGSTAGVTGDFPARLDRPHLGQRLSSWMVYAEGYPAGTCDLSLQHGRYVRRHVPFLSFADVQDNAEYCRDHVTDFPLFLAAAKEHRLPSFSLVVPNLDHDAHDRPLAEADAWLELNLGGLLNDADFRRDTILIVTFDESGSPWPYSKDDVNKVYAVLWGDHVVGKQVPSAYDHYDLLRTIEAILGAAPLSTEDAKARVIGGIWR